jgi:hypothetical protein
MLCVCSAGSQASSSGSPSESSLWYGGPCLLGLDLAYLCDLCCPSVSVQIVTLLSRVHPSFASTATMQNRVFLVVVTLALEGATISIALVPHGSLFPFMHTTKLSFLAVLGSGALLGSHLEPARLYINSRNK